MGGDVADALDDGTAPPSRGVATAARTYAPLLVIAALGLVLRIAMVLAVRPACADTDFRPGAGLPGPAPLEPPRCLRLTGDALFNYMQGWMLGEGKGFGNGFAYLDTGEYVASAGKPPLFPVWLGFLHLIGLRSVDAQRAATSLLGAIGVLLLGLLAWRLAGRRAGIIAAAVAAVSPLLWINDGKLMVEAFYVPLVAGVLLAAYELWRSPRPRTAAVLGVVLGFTCLARSEASMLFVVLVLPLVLALPRLSLRGRLTLGAVSILAGVLVVTPWVLRNLATFREPTFIQFGSGLALLNGNCEDAYHNADILGMESFACYEGEAAPWIAELLRPGERDESELDVLLRRKALDNMRADAGRLPVMVLYREGRIWELYRPFQNVELNHRIEDRGLPESWAALIAYAVTMPLAIGGAVVLRRRRVTIIPFVALAVGVALAVAPLFGIIRFRVGVDAAAVVLAAVAIDALLRRRAGAGDPTPASGAVVLAPPRPLRRRPEPAGTGA